MEKRYFEGYKGVQVPYLFFESNRGNRIKNNVVIFHGVMEPVSRYEEFGEFLAANGYNVYIPEIRGHGELQEEGYCDFGKGGISNVFGDMELFFSKELQSYGVNAENTTIFGHSMGALITLREVIRNNYKYLILSGLPLQKKMTVFGGRAFVFLEKMLFFRKKSLFNNQFEKYNSYFKPNRTEFDWLSRDTGEVDKYIESEYCGMPAKSGVFEGIFQMMAFINRNYRKIRKDARMLIIYGTEDKAVNKDYVNKILEVLKRKKRRINLLENRNGRHESLNEINKYEIYDEILKWLNEREK